MNVMRNNMKKKQTKTMKLVKLEEKHNPQQKSLKIK